MSSSEVFLVAMLIIFTAPYLLWRLGRTEYFAPLVVVQIVPAEPQFSLPGWPWPT